MGKRCHGNEFVGAERRGLWRHVVQAAQKVDVWFFEVRGGHGKELIERDKAVQNNGNVINEWQRDRAIRSGLKIDVVWFQLLAKSCYEISWKNTLSSNSRQHGWVMRAPYWLKRDRHDRGLKPARVILSCPSEGIARRFPDFLCLAVLASSFKFKSYL